MTRRLSALVLVSLGLLVILSCDRLKDPGTLMDAGNNFSSSDAASVMQGELEPRTFTDAIGSRMHVASSFRR
jgi:hypothetical protein